MFNLKKARKYQRGLSHILNYAMMVDPGVMLGKDGSLTAGWWVEGEDLTSRTRQEIDAVADRLNSVLNRLDNGWCIQHHAVRRPAMDYPDATFPDPVSKIMDDERREHFESEGQHYTTMLAVTATYLPPLRGKGKFLEMMLEVDEDDKDTSREIRIIRTFQQFCGRIEEGLKTVFKVRRMEAWQGENEFGEYAEYDELVQFLNLCLTGEDHLMAINKCAMYCDSYLGRKEFVGGMLPKIGDRWIGVIAIDGFPAQSQAAMLDGLDRLPWEYRLTHRFTFLDANQAKSMIDRTRRQWDQKKRGFIQQIFNMQGGAVNLDAEAMSEDAQMAQAAAESGEVKFGHYVGQIIIMDEDKDVLDRAIKETIKIIQNAGFECRHETINAVEGFLGSVPGHGHMNIRQPLVMTKNLADMVPTVSLWTGQPYAPCPFYAPQSPPLMLTSSEGSTPFYLNVHQSDLGHTLIIGPTGSGKSTLLASLVGSIRKYPKAKIFCFDKGKSMYALTKACGGVFYNVQIDDDEDEDMAATGEEINTPKFCPLGHLTIKDRKGIGKAIDWLARMVTLQGVTVTAEEMKLISDAVMQLAQNPDREQKTISQVSALIQNRELRTALEYYTIGGVMNDMLDSETDSLRESDFQTFELEDLMNMDDKAVIPVLTYLFDAIERRLDGSPAFIVLDEAWIMLGHPTFKAKIREWFKVLRKANCAVILATQSLSDLANSGIMDVISESCQSKIFLPNPSAMQRGTAEAPGHFDLYTRMGLNVAQISHIAKSIPKRQYYMSTPQGSRKFELGLGPVQLSFVGASSKEDIKRMKELEKEHQNDWPWYWLEERGAIDEQKANEHLHNKGALV